MLSSKGVSLIKFQIFIPIERATQDHPEWQIFNDLSLSEKEWQQVAEYARKKKLTILADIFGEVGFAIAKKINVDGYKIHSEDLLNTHFIAKVAAENKILLIGVGGAHRTEIYNTLNFLHDNDLCKDYINAGVQVFPSPIQAHSIEEVGDLLDKYKDMALSWLCRSCFWRFRRSIDLTFDGLS